MTISKIAFLIKISLAEPSLESLKFRKMFLSIFFNIYNYKNIFFNNDKHFFFLNQTSRVIAIRREDQSVWERRAPFSPNNVKRLVKNNVKVIVQPSNRRAYPMQVIINTICFSFFINVLILIYKFLFPVLHQRGSCGPRRHQRSLRDFWGQTSTCRTINSQ